MEWLIIDNYNDHERGGTRVGHALQECIPNARIILPPKDRTRYSELYKYAKARLNIIPRELCRKDIRVISNINYPLPTASDAVQFAYVHCPNTSHMMQLSQEYGEKANAEIGFISNVHTIRKNIRIRINISLYNYLQLKHAKSTKFLVNSKWGADVARSEITQAKSIVTVYPPCDIPDTTVKKERDRKIDVISIGAITPYKRHHATIDMCARTKSAKNVMIIGFAYNSYPEKPYLEKLQEIATRNNDNNPSKDRKFVINTSCNDDEEKHKHMYNAKCVVSAHWQEHFGIAVVEAISRGCIPVVPDAMGFKETVPFKELRFSDEKIEAPQIIDNVLNGSYDDLVPKLKAHVSKFSKEAFFAAIKREVLQEV